MEDRLVGGVSGGGVSDSPAATEPGSSSRRRVGGQKRKSIAISSSMPVSLNPSKRATREKAAVPIYPLFHHNGPLTRAARITPGSDPSPASPISSTPLKFEDNATDASVEEGEDGRKLEEMEAAMESEFETIRSRDANSHVVPSHCGWFSWSKTHSIEERSLPSFFNGKLETRTPISYLRIRNRIMKKFHVDPSAQIEVNDLNELETGEAEDRKEIWEFLDRWGLINFHPFPKLESADENGDGMETTDPLIDKLFHFEAIPAAPVLVAPKVNVSTPSVSKLLIESSMLEEFSKAEGPSVEYHCNSCAADCSRERYHCQKQADYDLCANCFSNGKFDSNMSSSDFILMEHADAPGIGGGKWTDQETLLLLEALEIFENNWSEIAEHVATKTKAQCLLHFLQMPIEDSFLECDDDFSVNSKDTHNPETHVDDVSAIKEIPDRAESKAIGKEGTLTASERKNSQPDGDESKILLNTKNIGIGCEAKVSEGTSKPEDGDKVEDVLTTTESFAVKALTEAFDAVGYAPSSEFGLSFANIGNPVMALAVFLARFVGPELTTASARCSLKSLSFTSPGMQLAARHCFLLEDPPDDMNDEIENCTISETADLAAGDDVRYNDSLKDATLSLANEQKYSGDEVSPNSCSYDSSQKANGVEADVASKHEESNSIKGSGNSSKKGCPSNIAKAMKEGSSLTMRTKRTGAVKDIKIEQTESSNSVSALEGTLKSADASSKDDETSVDLKLPESSDLSQSGKPGSKENGLVQQKSKDSLARRAENDKQPSATEREATAADKSAVGGPMKFEDRYCVDKLKSAAMAALSAAVVKAKLLANQEEAMIQQLTASLVEKQLHKLEMKLAFCHDMENAVTRVRELMERSRQKLFQERAHIIASRLGYPGSSRPSLPSLPGGRVAAMNFPNSVVRPPMLAMNPSRPPIPRPIGSFAPGVPGQFPSSSPGLSLRPAPQENFSSFGTK